MALISQVRRQFLRAVGVSGVVGAWAGSANASSNSNDSGTDQSRILIENGTVISMDPDIGVLNEADILVEGSRIQAIEDNLEQSGARIIDASGKLVLPGFVNTHAHLWQTPIRGIAGDLSLIEYFNNVHTQRPNYTPNDLYLGNLMGSLEQINAGTTTVLDFSHALATFGHAEQAINGLLESGVRAVFAHAPPIDPEWWEDSTLEHPENSVRRSADRLADESLVDLGLAIRGPDFSTDAVTEHDIRLAREYDALATMHIGVSTYEGPDDHGLPELTDKGLLGPDINFVHANAFEEELYELVVDEGISVSVTPEVEMQMGHGLPATGDLLQAGGNPVLGTDIVSGHSGDMFTQTRVALQFERGLRNAEILERDEIPETLNLTTRDALRFATIHGAEALGKADEIGSLTPGKQADIILLSRLDPNTVPVHDPIQSAVLQAGPENVDTVLINGRILKCNGQLVFPQLERKRNQLVQAGNRLLQQAGFQPGE